MCVCAHSNSLNAVLRWGTALVKFISIVKLILTARVGEIWDSVGRHIHVTGGSDTATGCRRTTPYTPKGWKGTQCFKYDYSYFTLQLFIYFLHIWQALSSKWAMPWALLIINICYKFLSIGSANILFRPATWLQQTMSKCVLADIII